MFCFACVSWPAGRGLGQRDAPWDGRPPSSTHSELAGTAADSAFVFLQDRPAMQLYQPGARNRKRMSSAGKSYDCGPAGHSPEPGTDQCYEVIALATGLDKGFEKSKEEDWACGCCDWVTWSSIDFEQRQDASERERHLFRLRAWMSFLGFWSTGARKSWVHTKYFNNGWEWVRFMKWSFWKIKTWGKNSRPIREQLWALTVRLQ